MNQRLLILGLCLTFIFMHEVESKVNSEIYQRIERSREISVMYREFYMHKLREFIHKINQENGNAYQASHEPLLIG